MPWRARFVLDACQPSVLWGRWVDEEETNASISPAGPAPIMRTSVVSDGRSGVWMEGMVISVRMEATEGVFFSGMQSCSSCGNWELAINNQE